MEATGGDMKENTNYSLNAKTSLTCDWLHNCFCLFINFFEVIVQMGKQIMRERCCFALLPLQKRGEKHTYGNDPSVGWS